MRIRYSALARIDLADILEYYESEAGLAVAKDFFAEFENAKKRIAANPASFPELEPDVRRCLFRRFPYQINFQIIDAATVKILMIKHQRRDPDFGLNR